MSGTLNGRRKLADALPRAHEALGDCGLAREKFGGYLGGAESAKRAQRESGLRLGGELRMKARKHHAQHVIREGVVRFIIHRRGEPALVLGGDALFLFIPALLTSELG